MMCFNVPFVNGNIPYLNVTNITVGTQAVDLNMGFRNIRPVGLMLVRISSAIPTGTTDTLPVTLTLNDRPARPLTFFNGTEVTVADLEGTGVLLVFNDKFNGILQLLSTPAATA